MKPICRKLCARATASFIFCASRSDSAGGFSQNVGLPRSGAGNHVIAMRVRGADDDDGVDRGIVDESKRIGIPLGHVEFARGVLGELGIGVGDSREAHTG